MMFQAERWQHVRHCHMRATGAVKRLPRLVVGSQVRETIIGPVKFWALVWK